ncbi:MAG: hypothetical protein ACFFA3_10750 [Promethearchaeota archaeon]
MDSGEDYITPEFLNIIFFQQKNVVIFPYVDLKHLHALEIFALGYNIVDLESTVLYDLKNILEFEASNSYSQNPSLYFIYNLDKSKVQELTELSGIRCILNTNENITEIATSTEFIIYNKKSGIFVNYAENDLEFEKALISSSTSLTMLQDSIQKIKSTATQLFEQMNQDPSPNKVASLLCEYNIRYWQKILDYTSRYFKIQLPSSSELRKYASDASFVKPRNKLLDKDFSEEYELIVSKNRAIGKEFVQLIHDYRSEKVNASHLGLEELYSPLKLYNYLRNRHWKEGIPERFIKEWSEMKLSGYELTEEDLIDFEDICSTLEISFIGKSLSPQKLSDTSIRPRIPDDTFISKKPSLQENWRGYKLWLHERVESISHLVDKCIASHNNEQYSYLLKEISQLSKSIIQAKVSPIKESVRNEIDTKLAKVRIKEWVALFSIEDKFRLVSIFRKYLERLYNDFFGRDPFNENIVPKIKAVTKCFQLSMKLESNLLWLNNFRNKLTHDDRYSDSEINLMLSVNTPRINNIIMRFIAGLITSQLRPLLQANRHLIDELFGYIRSTYFNAEYISTLPVDLIYERILVV